MLECRQVFGSGCCGFGQRLTSGAWKSIQKMAT